MRPPLPLLLVALVACRSTAPTTPAVADADAGATMPASSEIAVAPTTPAAIPPHDKPLEITVRGAKHPEQLHLLAGDTPLTLDKKGHWQGTVHGSGPILVQAAPGTREELKPAKVDLETDEGVARVLMFVDQPFQQACAR